MENDIKALTAPTLDLPLNERLKAWRKALDLPLNERLKAWRKGNNPDGKKMTLQAANDLLGLSIGYISDLETGKVPITMQVYRKYNAADPASFPVADAGLLL